MTPKASIKLNRKDDIVKVSLLLTLEELQALSNAVANWNTTVGKELQRYFREAVTRTAQPNRIYEAVGCCFKPNESQMKANNENFKSKTTLTYA